MHRKKRPTQIEIDTWHCKLRQALPSVRIWPSLPTETYRNTKNTQLCRISHYILHIFIIWIELDYGLLFCTRSQLFTTGSVKYVFFWLQKCRVTFISSQAQLQSKNCRRTRKKRRTIYFIGKVLHVVNLIHFNCIISNELDYISYDELNPFIGTFYRFVSIVFTIHWHFLSSPKK